MLILAVLIAFKAGILLLCGIFAYRVFAPELRAPDQSRPEPR